MKRILVCCCSFMLTGCLSVQKECMPVSQIASNYLGSELTVRDFEDSELVETQWWKLFEDADLIWLIKRALAQNVELKIAEKNVEASRILRSMAQAGYLPNVNVGIQFLKQRLSQNADIPAGFQLPVEKTVYDVGFDASWELDFWHRKRCAVQTYQFRMLAAQEEHNELLLVTMAEVGRHYAEFRGIQRRMACTQRQVELRRKALDIIRQMNDVGTVSSLEIAQAELKLYSIEALLPNQEALIHGTVCSLAVLTGLDTRQLLDTLLASRPPSVKLDIVPEDLSSDLLRQRPDIRRSECELQAAHATLGKAVAELFPSFSLFGKAGLKSPRFDDLIETASTTWAMGTTIQWPVFRGGQMRGKVLLQQTGEEIAAFVYEQTIVQALNDVESVFARYHRGLISRDSLQEALKASQSVVELTLSRYDQGEDSLLALIESKLESVLIEENLILTETRALVDLISFYKALGGGWPGLVSEELDSV